MDQSISKWTVRQPTARETPRLIVLHRALELWARVGCGRRSARAKRAAATPERLRVLREKNRPTPCRNFPRKNESTDPEHFRRRGVCACLPCSPTPSIEG